MGALNNPRGSLPLKQPLPSCVFLLFAIGFRRRIARVVAHTLCVEYLPPHVYLPAQGVLGIGSSDVDLD